MKDKIYELDIDPATEYSNMKKAIEPDKWQKDWEENCLCNTCKNDCYDKDVITKECSNYKEVEGERCQYDKRIFQKVKKKMGYKKSSVISDG